jgi:hypothetical protein
MRAVWLDRSGSGTSANGIGVIQSLLELAPRIRGRSAA